MIEVSKKRSLTPQISPLRCAPVEMTKGRAALPATVVAEQDPVETHFQEETAENTDLSTTLRSGRDDKGEGRASCNCSCGTGPCRKHISKRRRLKTQISPLRCAPVEMTKGRAALPATVVAEQDPVEKHFQDEIAENADLSTTLRSGRDDKGEGRASSNSSC